MIALLVLVSLFHGIQHKVISYYLFLLSHFLLYILLLSFFLSFFSFLFFSFLFSLFLSFDDADACMTESELV